MFHKILRTKSERDGFIEIFKNLELPIKVYYDRILPKATHDQYKFLFGAIYKAIADYTGHTIHEVHKIYMQEFNLEYAPLPQNPTEFMFRVKSGSEFDVITIGQYIEQVTAKALTDLPGLYIPSPEEI